MSKAPIQGVKGAKIQPPKKQRRPTIAALPAEEGAALTREYMEGRINGQRLQNEGRELEVGLKRGELVRRRDVELQCAYLATGLRQNFFALMNSLPRQLVGLSEHEMRLLLQEEGRKFLLGLSNWPGRIVNKDWIEEIDDDLLPPPESGNGELKARPLT